MFQSGFSPYQITMKTIFRKFDLQLMNLDVLEISTWGQEMDEES